MKPITQQPEDKSKPNPNYKNVPIGSTMGYQWSHGGPVKELIWDGEIVREKTKSDRKSK